MELSEMNSLDPWGLKPTTLTSMGNPAPDRTSPRRANGLVNEPPAAAIPSLSLRAVDSESVQEGRQNGATFVPAATF